MEAGRENLKQLAKNAEQRVVQGFLLHTADATGAKLCAN